MALNPDVSLLDPPQIHKRTFDSTNDAIRTVPAASTAFAIELDAEDGDSVIAKLDRLSVTGAVTTLTPAGIVVAETACIGIKSFQLYSKTTLAITTPPTLTLEVSPTDSGDVWFITSSTLVPSVTLNAVVTFSVATAVARRVRVKTSAATAAGTADLYLVGYSA